MSMSHTLLYRIKQTFVLFNFGHWYRRFSLIRSFFLIIFSWFGPLFFLFQCFFYFIFQSCLTSLKRLKQLTLTPSTCLLLWLFNAHKNVHKNAIFTTMNFELTVKGAKLLANWSYWWAYSKNSTTSCSVPFFQARCLEIPPI